MLQQGGRGVKARPRRRERYKLTSVRSVKTMSPSRTRLNSQSTEYGCFPAGNPDVDNIIPTFVSPIFTFFVVPPLFLIFPCLQKKEFYQNGGPTFPRAKPTASFGTIEITDQQSHVAELSKYSGNPRPRRNYRCATSGSLLSGLAGNSPLNTAPFSWSGLVGRTPLPLNTGSPNQGKVKRKNRFRTSLKRSELGLRTLRKLANLGSPKVGDSHLRTAHSR